MTEIVKVEESHKADYMALFLLADPSEDRRPVGTRTPVSASRRVSRRRSVSGITPGRIGMLTPA